MKRRGVFMLMIVGTLLILGGGVWYAYQKGSLRPSADIVAMPSINYGDSNHPLSSGSMDGTVIQGGSIQLQTAQ